MSLDTIDPELVKGEDKIVIFNLIPEKFAQDERISVERSEIWAVFTAQDHYVEYYTDDGYSAGVLYQSGAFNYSLFSAERTTLIQAPKVYSSSEVTTFLLVINNSFEDQYATVADLKCCMVDESGIAKVRWQEKIKPFELRLINLSEKISAQLDSKSLGRETVFATFYGLCPNVALLPLTVSLNKVTGTLAVEHSLPPNYYASTFVRDVRREGVQNLSKSSIFQHELRVN
jgi:hypothetical protein